VESKFVNIVNNLGQLHLQSFSLSYAQHQLACLCFSQWESLDDLPVVKHTLRESLALGIASEHTCEAERFRDWEKSFDQVQRSTRNLDFFNDLTSSLIE